MASPKFGFVRVGVLLLVCIWLLSVDFTESRGAARRHNAVRSGRSGGSKQLKRDGVSKTRCCLPSGIAVTENISRSKFVYDSNQIVIESETRWDNNSVVIATNGFKQLTIEEGFSPKLTIPILPPDSDCTSHCYTIFNYRILDQQDEICTDLYSVSWSDSFGTELCLFQMNDTQLHETDQPGVIKAVGYDELSGNELTVEFKRFGDGCIPISIDVAPFVYEGDEPNTTLVHHITSTFEEAPFKASYNDLLALTEDNMKQCRF